MFTETFEKEVSFASQVLEDGQLVRKRVKKTATFKKLDPSDKSQHKLHSSLLTLYVNRRKDDDDTEDGVISLDSSALFDITTKAIKVLLIPDKYDSTNPGNQIFTDTDKAELLNDSIGIIQLSMYLIKDHFTPFFLLL